MKREMITFQTCQAKFTCRVAGVALHGGHVLLHRAEQDDFWSLPGGRGELLEQAADTLHREMREELGADVRVERLLWVVELFFQHLLPHHELGLYFLMTLPPEFCDVHRPLAGCETGFESGGHAGTADIRLIFEWHPLHQLHATRLYPTFLREALQAIPSATDPRGARGSARRGLEPRRGQWIGRQTMTRLLQSMRATARSIRRSWRRSARLSQRPPGCWK